MIEDPAGRIDYEEIPGDGPTLVLVPGSCSTGAAWRPVVAALGGRFRCVFTSLLGYGGTAERRTSADAAIEHEAAILEAVIARAGGPVHLIGHSFGGLAALAVALRGTAPLLSLTILEAPAMELLRELGEYSPYQDFREMNRVYFDAFGRGEPEAIATMIDFYGGPGSFAALPPKVRAYAAATTPANILDWASAYGFRLAPPALAALALPTLVLRGGASHPAARRANELLAAHLGDGVLATVEGAAHFMISTHPEQTARLIARHVSACGMRGAA